MTEPRSGFVGLAGRPNVGKSTLLNKLIGSKISITSRKPQTTRHRILGIETSAKGQIVYVDTPGIHRSRTSMMSTYLSRVTRAGLGDMDCILLLASVEGWTDEDDAAYEVVKNLGAPVILVINKIDRLQRRSDLLPLIERYAERGLFVEIVPVSARRGTNLAVLRQAILRYLPAQAPIYPADQLTDRSLRFLAGERVREQIFRFYGQELPYACAIEISQFKESRKMVQIEAVIWVEKEGQKGILIGKGGERLKKVGERARREIEQLMQKRVNLKLWVKVRKNWSTDQQTLASMGYSEDR